MQENNPQISILMAVFNGLPYLLESLDSLLMQTFSDFELVVVDDASTDNTLKVLNEYAERDDRIVVLHNEKNLKLPASLNRGLRVCRAPLVARADADDIYLPERLEKQVEFMASHPEVGVLGAAGWEIDEQGNKSGMCRFPAEDKFIRLELPFITRISHPAAMFRKDIVLSAGGYDEKFWTGQDFQLWSRLIGLTRFANISEPLWHYRNLQGSISNTRGASGIGLVRQVSQRLLSDYLERDLSLHEVEAILLIYRSWDAVRMDLVQMGVKLCREYLQKAIMKEDHTTIRFLKENLAGAFLRQSIYQTGSSRILSMKLFISAISLYPGKALTIQGAKQVLRLIIPNYFIRLLNSYSISLPY